MKLIYAKLWVKKWIKYNHGKYSSKIFKQKLNRAIVNLSHRVYKTHGIKGHNIRQKIRQQLWTYARAELKHYQPSTISKIINYLKKVIRGK